MTTPTEPTGPVQVTVKYNDFTGLWEVHGLRVSYWMFEQPARTRRDEIQKKLDAEYANRTRNPQR